ncbi:MAG: hypothetical protein ACXWRE_12300 [Pseudobdellovibrionaceae bacterium]
MRMTIVLGSVLSSMCFFLVSCATLSGDGTAPTEQPLFVDSNTAPSTETSVDQPVIEPQESASDPVQANMEVQAAEHQEAQVAALNEQRSTAELDGAAPETGGVDAFYASSQPQLPEVEPVAPEIPASSLELPKKISLKRSKKSVHKMAKSSKHAQKKIAKNKHSKKSSKSIAKKSKAECKKIAKNLKKHSKREIAMCKAEIKKLAHKSKSHKLGKVAKAGVSM